MPNFIYSESSFVTCKDCGKLCIKHETARRIGFPNIWVCTDCLEENYFNCNICGGYYHTDQLELVDGDGICQECFSRYTFVCSDCGEIHLDIHRVRTNNGRQICMDCYNDAYGTCDECDGVFYMEELIDNNGIWLCPTCYNEIQDKVIHDYYYKPFPIFYGATGFDTAPLYMGVELEIDGAGEDHEKAKDILDTINHKYDFVYAKHDGSLNDGFEIVSHPATLDFHLTQINWARLMECATSWGYKSHNTRTCGLHVHVSRAALNTTESDDEEVSSRIIQFVETHWDKVLRFTRRSAEKLEEWAGRYGIESTVKETAKKVKHQDRYKCVNLKNASTIEFRMFRGTLNPDTFRATLQFVEVVCVVCKENDDKTIEKMSWADFCRAINPEKMPELVNYMNAKNIWEG